MRGFIYFLYSPPPLYPIKETASILNVRLLQCSHGSDSARPCPAITVNLRKEGAADLRPRKFSTSGANCLSFLPHQLFSSTVAWARAGTVVMGSGALVNASGVYFGEFLAEYAISSAPEVVRTLKVPFTVTFEEG